MLCGVSVRGVVWLLNPRRIGIDTAVMIYAKALNALVVQLEHRFYGACFFFPLLLCDPSGSCLCLTYVSRAHPRPRPDPSAP